MTRKFTPSVQANEFSLVSGLSFGIDQVVIYRQSNMSAGLFAQSRDVVLASVVNIDCEYVPFAIDPVGLSRTE